MPNRTITYVTFHWGHSVGGSYDAAVAQDTASMRAAQAHSSPNLVSDRTVNLGLFKMKLHRETVTQATLLAQLPHLRDWGSRVAGNFVVLGPPPNPHNAARTAPSSSVASGQSVQAGSMHGPGTELPTEISFVSMSGSNDDELAGPPTVPPTLNDAG